MTDTDTNELIFKVRAPFCPKRERSLQRAGLKPQRRVDAFWPGEIIGLRPDEVVKHAHQIEPTDEASASALAALEYKPPPQAPEAEQAGLVTGRQIAELVTQAVAMGIAEAIRLQADPDAARRRKVR